MRGLLVEVPADRDCLLPPCALSAESSRLQVLGDMQVGQNCAQVSIPLTSGLA